MEVSPLFVSIFCVLGCGILLAWGVLALFRPERFGELARVDWNADVVDPRDRRHRTMVRILGFVATLVSGVFLALILVALFR